MTDAKKQIRVVVVGTDSLTTEYLRTILDPHRFVVDTTDPTLDGIARAQESSPVLFVIDDLEGMNGLKTACQTIRQYSWMPILALSSLRSPNVVEQVLDAGADDFLSKPVPGSVLMAHLNTLARRALAEQDAALAIVHGERTPGQSLGLLIY